MKDFEKYISYLRMSGYSEHTIRAYEYDLGSLHMQLGKYPTGLEEAATHCLSTVVSSSSRTRKIAAINSYAKWSGQKLSLPKPKIPKRLPVVVALQEIENAVRKISTIRDRAILEVLYSTGIRIGELVRLSVGSLDFDAGLIKIYGKGSKERVVPVCRRTRSSIQKYFLRREHLEPSDPLFASHAKEKRITEAGARAMIRKYVNYSPHIFRHTFATHLLDHGADIRVIQELLGHASIASTQIYTHVSRTTLQSAYNAAHPWGDKSKS